MSTKLRKADIGAWLFKCNPKEWDIEAALSSGRSIDSWRVHDSYRLGMIAAGDPAVLWVTGSRGAAPVPGIWLAGRTTGQFFDGQGDEFWFNEARQLSVSIFAGLEMTLLDSPVPRDELRADSRTASMEVMRQPQMSNPSYLTKAERDAVEEMIGVWPTKGP